MQEEEKGFKSTNDISGNEIAGKIFLVIGGLVSGGLLIWAGVKMLGLESVSGTSLAEAYYQDMGLGFIGLGIFAAAVLFYFAARK